MHNEKKKIIIHIGQHKTGSKALQSCLFENAAILEKHGFYYPRKDSSYKKISAYRNSHYRFYALLRMETLKTYDNSELSKKYWLDQKNICSPHESIREMLESKFIKKATVKNQTIVLSAEDLFDMHSAHEIDFSIEIVKRATKILSEILTSLNYEPTIVVYLRRQDHLLTAHYAQYIKGSATNNGSFSEFKTKFEPRLNTWEILSQWISAFGKDKIIVRTYEPFLKEFDIRQDFFQHILKCALPTKNKDSSKNVESANITPSRDYIEFMRILNARASKNLKVFCRRQVLESAFNENINSQSLGNDSLWLSPEDQDELLKKYDKGNTKIAAIFFEKNRWSGLFLEPRAENKGCKPYSGLTADRALAIALSLDNTQRFLLSPFLFRYIKAFSGKIVSFCSVIAIKSL